MKKCLKCNTLKQLDEFHNSSRFLDGKQKWCKSCKSLHSQQYYNDNKRTILERSKKRNKKDFERYKEWKQQYVSSGCERCGETDPVCLDFHHLNPQEKEFTISELKGCSEKRRIEEASKCIVVCRNCHAKIHAHEMK